MNKIPGFEFAILIFLVCSPAAWSGGEKESAKPKHHFKVNSNHDPMDVEMIHEFPQLKDNQSRDPLADARFKDIFINHIIPYLVRSEGSSYYGKLALVNKTFNNWVKQAGCNEFTSFLPVTNSQFLSDRIFTFLTQIYREEIGLSHDPPNSPPNIASASNKAKFIEYIKEYSLPITELLEFLNEDDFLKITNLLIDNKLVNFPFNLPGRSAIHLLQIFSNHPKSARLLIDNGFNPNQLLPIGFTPLMVSAIVGNLEITEFLINSGADINKTDKDGNSALHLIMHENHQKIVKALINAGAKVDQRGLSGMTPLMTSVIKGNIDMVNLLSESSADVNQTDDNGLSAMHYAIQGGKFEVIKALFEAGANLNPFDKNGAKTFKLLLQSSNRSNFLSYLKSRSSQQFKAPSTVEIEEGSGEHHQKPDHPTDPRPSKRSRNK